MRIPTSIPVVLALWFAGCAGDRHPCNPCDPCDPCNPCAPVVGELAIAPPAARAPTTATAPTPPARAYAFFDGTTGAATSIEAFLGGADHADLVAFGELHGHPVGAAMELKVLEGMAAGTRPVALALEFFERDVQGALDAYLAGKTTEVEFLKVARQGPAYPATHRPLVEFAKAHHLAVLAANAPRRLVTEYRKGEKSYADFVAGLAPVDRGFLPAETTVATGPYLDRFTKLMGGERGSKLVKAQSLWDDAMADVVAAHRATHPDVRVLLVAGGFHVAARLGTITKFSARRPGDRISLLVMSQGEPAALVFDPDDRGEGDVILMVTPVAVAPALRPAPVPAQKP